jgi:hypothetical protein
MSTERRHIITCDHPYCPVFITASSAFLARQAARDAGWIGRAGNDYCKAHAPEYK